jgi:glycosyltransferase involved in cell wall biosynthesis
VLVGDGERRRELQQLADSTNAELGRPAVILTGELLDPRPAYAAADLVVGMGSSALRAMAFGKPVVIAGERGFSAKFTPESANCFYYKGMYGLGNGSPDNSQLIAEIRELAEHPDLRSALGEFSRQFVVKHFALEVASARLAKFCETAISQSRNFHITAADSLRTGAVLVAGALRRAIKWSQVKRHIRVNLNPA